MLAMELWMKTSSPSSCQKRTCNCEQRISKENIFMYVAEVMAMLLLQATKSENIWRQLEELQAEDEG